ncbi:hypothetical protein Patl1_32660 [Pistacia atlantica]|uniref:Uncharacterized protein n=1 Tax=Pistacia atlantica TaxID=434234 RepID=A0ACC1ALR7_9ROSI|nr:hypothetical protein Patl1_32660 [Pistacia atlantica]
MYYRGKNFLIVGTKNKGADLVERVAIRTRCHYVNKKWFGGMLTNWDLRTEQERGRLNRLFTRRCSYVEKKIITLANVSEQD